MRLPIRSRRSRRGILQQRILIGLAAIAFAAGASGCLAAEAPSLMYSGYKYQAKMNRQSLDADAFAPAPDAARREREANLPPDLPASGN